MGNTWPEGIPGLVWPVNSGGERAQGTRSIDSNGCLIFMWKRPENNKYHQSAKICLSLLKKKKKENVNNAGVIM